MRLSTLTLTTSLLILCLTMVCTAATTHAYVSGKQTVKYEIFGDEDAAPTLILLHGSSGPDVALYRDQASYFASKGFRVLMPHYFDASGSSLANDGNYKLWAQAVEDLVSECRKNSKDANPQIALVGYSLGASVALAVGSQRAPVAAIADWYGSLPDEFFQKLKGMPPLLILHGSRDVIIPIINAQQLVRLCGMAKLTCESHIYADQGHGFAGEALKDADDRTIEFFSRTMGRTAPAK